MSNQKIYFYVEMEGAELDIVPLYSVFSKCSCYGSPVGDTYSFYNDEGDKITRCRKEAYFQARFEYNTTSEDPLNEIVCEFLNTHCYEGAPLRDIMTKNRVSVWCSIASDAPKIVMTLGQSAMRKLLEVGLDLRVTVMQNGHVIARA